ncbi:glycosyltransferase family 4 protein [Mucilaginibacter sp. ZT4R22]|uniref:Glycosyltransferase family 4 protein n=1 Tax=Mucilaginibacter pankratovii TaxID=2772110 RepID=A0ABR7WTM6_9SPHI|nr:glycosyltransferase family 4 protein [Mucilaginibacter pankratovii]MBD1364882.1 glycosyltransferase family 4 protein [Mucilaginibacter pankratovii]
MPDTLIILTPGFPADETDTTCIPPQQVFVRALKENYPKLQIIVLSFQYPFEEKEYVWHGIKVIAFGGQGKGGARRMLIWFKAWQCLRAIRERHNCLGILSFWLGEVAFVGSLFAKLNKLKHYSWLLGQDAKAGNKYPRWIKPRNTELIAISDFIADRYHQNYGITPGHVIPVGVSPQPFKGTGDTRDIDLLAAGSLIPLKRYHLFVELVNELKKEHPNIRAVLCGAGPEMERLRALAAEHELNDNLILKGELPHQQVLDLMQHAKVFVHPSEYEGFSTVCLEALDAGAGVVSFIKAMDADIPNWHIAKTSEEMHGIVRELLNNSAREYQSLLPYSVNNSAKAMMALFNYRD